MRFSTRAMMVTMSAIFACFVPSIRTEAGMLYPQPPQVGSGVYTTFTSAYTDSFLDYYQTLDNFQLTANSTIASISWQGSYITFNQTNGNSNRAPTRTTG